MLRQDVANEIIKLARLIGWLCLVWLVWGDLCLCVWVSVVLVRLFAYEPSWLVFEFV